MLCEMTSMQCDALHAFDFYRLNNFKNKLFCSKLLTLFKSLL